MGIREVFHQVERNEIRALPYVSASVRNKVHQEFIHNQGSPPTVFVIPEKWKLCVMWVLVLHYMGFVNVILRL